jgi:hypothetical protein
LGGSGQTLSDWKNHWTSKYMHSLSALFINRLDTKERLTVSESKQLFSGSPHESRNSLHFVYSDNEKEEFISKFFRDAFNENLVVNRRAGQYVS